ncbi:hypothetical protein GCM10009726_14450 [Nocardioides furvisabuli]|uniref:Uncharacterized protein n=1 Tax=Nocardioides furvisabuli TaxID=375542 RepID=A0ABN2X248_9ACTN
MQAVEGESRGAGPEDDAEHGRRGAGQQALEQQADGDHEHRAADGLREVERCRRVRGDHQQPRPVAVGRGDAEHAALVLRGDRRVDEGARDAGGEHGGAEAAEGERAEQAGVAQVEAAEGQAREEVGQPGHDRVVAGEEQLAGQPARVVQLREGRVLVAALRQVGAQDVRGHGGEDHPRDGEQHQRARPEEGERDAEDEQHAVVGEDHCDAAVEAPQRQAQQRDEHRPAEDAEGAQDLRAPPQRLARHQREAHPGEHGEERRGTAAGEPLRGRELAVGGARVEDVGGDHAEERQAPGDVEPDEAALARRGHAPILPGTSRRARRQPPGRVTCSARRAGAWRQ